MSTNHRGYILYEVLIALTVFALAITGLMQVLSLTIDAANEIAFERAVHRGLESILTEARHRDVADMSIDYLDEVLEVAYHTEVEELQLANTEGQTLTGMYKLTATATYQVGAEQVEDAAEIWIYDNSTRPPQ